MENLIFDGSYILMKAVFAAHRMNSLYGSLWKLLDNNLDKYMSLNRWENVIFVSDSRKKSWRTKLLSKYKGTRTKSIDIDWDFVFETYTNWKESVKDKVIVLEQDHIEGDDWITTLLFKFNKLGKSNCTIASDHDLFQLIKYMIKENSSFMNIQISDIMSNEHVYLPEGWQLWLKHKEENVNNDVFALDNSTDNLNFFKHVHTRFQSTEINPKQQLFEKLIQGDKSDNISSIYLKLTKTGKVQGIGKAGATKIWNFYKENYSENFKIDDNFYNDVVNCIEKVNKITLDKDKCDTIKENLKLNISMIELHHKHLPEFVIDGIIEQVNEKVFY